METTRAQAAASALGPVRAEGLEPDAQTLQVLELWSTGVLDDRGLEQVRERLEARQPIEDLLPAVPHR